MGDELSLVLNYSIKLQYGLESLGWRLGEGLVVKLDSPELWITVHHRGAQTRTSGRNVKGIHC